MSDDFDDWIPAPGEHPTWSMEEIESHPLFMRDVSGKTTNVHVEALQSVLFDDESPLGIASSLKEQGNEALRLGLLNDASICYQRALDAGCTDSELLSQIHSNLALAFLKQNKFPDCVDECFRAIGENAKNIKAFYRGASASDQLELYSQGIYFAKGGLEVDPDNTELKCLLEKLESKRGAQLRANESRNQSSASSTSASKPKLKYRWRDYQLRNITIMKTLSQLGAVLRKSFLIKSKTPISSLVEIFMPVLLLFLFTRINDKTLVENSFRPFLCLIYSTSMGGLVSNVVTEREQRISEMMKILGLPNWIFYSSWFIFYAIMLAVPSLLVSLVMVFSDVAPDGNVVTVFIYYLLYSVSSIAFSLLLSAPFDSAKVAQTVGFLVYGLVSIVGTFIKPDWSKGTKLAVTFLLPSLGFSLGYDSAAPRGMTWANISIEKDNFSVSDAMLMMFLSTIFFMLCYVYFDQVLPHEVGFRRPWHFPFECLMGPIRNESSSSSSAHAASNDEHDELVGGTGGDQAAPSSVTVETKGLSKRYNATRQALNDVNLKLKSGELTVLLGRNGAGKTTLINILTGMTEPSSGTARVFGHSVHGALDKVRENTGFCPQHDIQWAKLTVKEHFEIFGAFRDLPAAVIKERMNRLLASIGLKDKENSPVSELSGGMKRKLSVALAFLGDSKFVILDEPTSGLDPLSRRHMWTVLGKMREDRVVLLSTHYMDEAEVLGERVVILSDGQVRANGSVSELKREFDCGYELVFELSKSSSAFNMSSFEKVVKRIVNSAKIPHPTKAAQLVTVNLPVDAAQFIPDLLADIREKFGAGKTFKSGIQIKSKRLEEVFMAVALDGEVEEIVLPPENDEADFDGINAVENGGNVPRIAVDYVEGGGGIGLLLSQIVGTVVKRYRLFTREIRTSIMQNLFPVLMIVVGIATVKFTRKDDLSAHEAKDKPEKWMDNFFSDMAMVTFIQFAFTSISSGIVANLARESQTHSKFLQYIAGLMPLAYWLGSFLADVFEYFALPFAYTSISLAALNLSIPISPFLALLACFGPGVVAQTYAISVLITNPVVSKLFSYFVTLILGLILPMVFFYLRVGQKIETLLPILETICRMFPSFNLGQGFLSVNIYATAQIMASKMTKNAWKNAFENLPGATASSVYDYSACGAAIIWMIGATLLLLGIAVFVDDLRYKNKTTFSSSSFTPPPEPVGFVEDESVARERATARRSTPGSMAMLVVDVSKQWISNSVLAVNRVPLAVARNGEIFTLLGENGAGKTTLMTMAIGQILPSEGNIFIDKHNTRTELKEARQLIGYCPQFDALLPPLTVKDHLRLFARIKGIKSTSINFAVDRTIEWLGLGSYQNAKAKSLSGGYKRRLSLAIALMGKPEILILDEPSCGMDPVARRQMWKVMESASRDCALILTTHSMEEAEAVSTRLGIMSRGRMMCMGSATELREKFSNGVEVFVQTKVPSLDPLIVEQTTLSQTSFVALCHRHSQKRATRFVTSGLNIMMKQNSAESSVATSFAEWWAQETLNDELETLVRSKIVGVNNFEASGRSLRFVVEPLTKILTFDFISEIFTFLEHSKKEGLVLDYSVTQNSLDQVFRSIAAREQEPAYIGAPILAEAGPLE